MNGNLSLKASETCARQSCRMRTLKEPFFAMRSCAKPTCTEPICRRLTYAKPNCRRLTSAGPDLSYAKLQGAELEGAKCDAHTKWPQDFNEEAERVVCIDTPTITQEKMACYCCGRSIEVTNLVWFDQHRKDGVCTVCAAQMHRQGRRLRRGAIMARLRMT